MKRFFFFGAGSLTFLFISMGCTVEKTVQSGMVIDVVDSDSQSQPIAATFEEFLSSIDNLGVQLPSEFVMSMGRGGPVRLSIGKLGCKNVPDMPLVAELDPDEDRLIFFSQSGFDPIPFNEASDFLIEDCDGGFVTLLSGISMNLGENGSMHIEGTWVDQTCDDGIKDSPISDRCPKLDVRR